MRNLTPKRNFVNLQPIMMTERAILSNLHEKASLMEGVLRWKGEFREEPMTFHTDTAAFTAIPEIKKAVPAIVCDQFVSRERERRNQNKPPRLLVVPYLSEKILKRLGEEEQILAADLSGNGLIKSPPLYLRSTGCPNAYLDIRRMARPYDRIAAQAAMVLLEQKEWPGQKSILDRIALRGGTMAKGQLSKLVPCYEEDGILSRPGRSELIVYNPGRLMEKLREQWRRPEAGKGQDYIMGHGMDLRKLLQEASRQKIKWCLSPQSSLKRYASLGESGPLFLWTEEPSFFLKTGQLEKTASPAFSRLNLTLMESPLAYFQMEKDADGIIWSGPVMTWIEASRGDARQQETTRQLAGALTNFRYSTLPRFSHS